MIEFLLAELQPDPIVVFAALGLKKGITPSGRSQALLGRALAMFGELAEPQSLEQAVSRNEFAAVYQGQGRNAPATPLAEIFPRAERLDLFVFTLGARISEEIKRLFGSNDFALGSILDAVASLAADSAGRVAENWAASQAGGQKEGARPKSLLYSPGYCGWHISGQEKLFAKMRPERIGITLGSSFLMDPLKSISGVLVTGPAASHQFFTSYPFCAQCKSPTCRERGMARSA